MTQLQSVHVLDADPETDTDAPNSNFDTAPGTVDRAQLGQQRTLFADADEFDPRRDFPASRRARPRRFLRAVLDETIPGYDPSELRELDRCDQLTASADDGIDVSWATLLVAPDESILFVGSDPTTRETETSPLFGYHVGPTEPIPAPTTVRAALDRLRPLAVQRAFEETDGGPARQGEWFLLPTREIPVGSTFRGGLGSRPYDASPLGNHVPREYGFGVPDRRLIERLRAATALPDSVASVPEALAWIDRQPDYRETITWAEVRDRADHVYVRGDLRHREREHYDEFAGEDWHEAVTHDVDVWTGDDVGLGGVRID